MNPIRGYITRLAAVTAVVLGTVLAGLCVPSLADTPLNTDNTTVTASPVDPSDVGWQ
ncbi:hypothetical protein [Streptomyces sp. NPDC006355]|uniref:hypothetical protein n=1 Tax=Streptomyces sp. NPDC006355 TaxID=3156758 RepID=UPI0033B87ABF